ncbi:hypothetical protein B7P43_G15662 [Cryptotermes secundus]|uniref:Mos1 transposase HTH domain-containing protein n=1 Tax=Cryptotermes secundus TaxID=105785 RepID=A0A2J7RQU7_9NEOP|nr:hypothetical protein B7P43_G15662 [Cryptotermes secundus]
MELRCQRNMTHLFPGGSAWRKTHVTCQLWICAVRRMNIQLEQQVNIKFCVKLGKTATETLQLLHDADSNEALFRARVFEWHRQFVSGRVSMEDDTRSGWPSSSQNEDNVVFIRDMVRKTILLRCGHTECYVRYVRYTNRKISPFIANVTGRTDFRTLRTLCSLC